MKKTITITGADLQEVKYHIEVNLNTRQGVHAVRIMGPELYEQRVATTNDLEQVVNELELEARMKHQAKTTDQILLQLGFW